MANDISHAKSLVWVKLEHASDQILELVGEKSSWFTVGVSFPEKIGSICGKKLVVHVITVGHLEWWMLSQHYEENNSTGEQVNYLSLVWLLVKNLWCHVSWSTNHRPAETGSVPSFKWACESKIDKFHVEILIEKNIFGLQISVGESLGVEIVETKEHLLEVVSADLFAEWTSVCDVVKELTTKDRFLSDVSDWDFVSAFLILD